MRKSDLNQDYRRERHAYIRGEVKTVNKEITKPANRKFAYIGDRTANIHCTVLKDNFC